jgi:type II secretory pathway pseudopilin PulG
MRDKTFPKMNNISKKDGYIVAELIVVLIIIALLAVLLIPSVIDNIRIAKETAEIAQTQTAAVTLQALLTMTYSNEIRNPDGSSLSFDDIIRIDPKDRTNTTLSYRGYAEMYDLAGIGFGSIDNVVVENRINLISFRYTTENGSIVDFNRGQYFIIELYSTFIGSKVNDTL